jgi:hypothetical protein
MSVSSDLSVWILPTGPAGRPRLLRSAACLRVWPWVGAAMLEGADVTDESRASGIARADQAVMTWPPSGTEWHTGDTGSAAGQRVIRRPRPARNAGAGRVPQLPTA